MIRDSVRLSDGRMVPVVQVPVFKTGKPYSANFPILYGDGEWPKMVDDECMFAKSPQDLYRNIKEAARAAAQLCGVVVHSGKELWERTYVVADTKHILLSTETTDADTYESLVGNRDWALKQGVTEPFIVVRYYDQVFCQVRHQICSSSFDANIVTADGVFLHRIGDPFILIEPKTSRYDERPSHNLIKSGFELIRKAYQKVRHP